jgi:hypothetical protein
VNRILGFRADREGSSVHGTSDENRVPRRRLPLVIETPTPTLSRGMQWLNGTYAAWFIRKHTRWGHLLSDRFHAFLFENGTLRSGLRTFRRAKRSNGPEVMHTDVTKPRNAHDER